MFNFNFIPVTDIPYVDIPTDWMTFGDPFDKVEKLGFNSISTFVNNVSLLLSFIVIFIIHMLLKWMAWWKNTNHPNKFVRFIAQFRGKAIDLIFYIMYWRLLLEAHETLILSSTLEIKELQSASTPEVFSMIIAWVVLGICFMIPTVALYLFYTSRNEYDPEKKHVLMEFFEGIKNKKIARLYTGAALIRRVFFVWVVIFLAGNVDRLYIYITLLSIQGVYLTFIVSFTVFNI